VQGLPLEEVARDRGDGQWEFNMSGKPCWVTCSRMIADEVDVRLSDDNKWSMASKEYMQCCQWGMEAMGRVVALLPPCQMQRYELAILFLVIHEQGVCDADAEDEDRMLTGFWVEEVVEGGVGKDLFYVGREVVKIEESSILSWKGSREYKCSMKLTDLEHEGHFLWECRDIHTMRKLGKQELERQGKEKAQSMCYGFAS